jgi:predicted nucleotidyltransferase component of viral defense system
MKPSKQDLFNQFRENIVIEVVQAVAKSEAGAQIAFKGGTALKLFYGLPRYSEEADYDMLPGRSGEELLDILNRLSKRKKWEVTDRALKFYALLFELRFAGIDRNFRLKIEISTRLKEFDTGIQSLRGVPVLTLEPSFLMTEKLITFLNRNAGRDIFDAWFILNGAYQLNRQMIEDAFGSEVAFFKAILRKVDRADQKAISRDTGKLLGPDQRKWIKTSLFLDSFQLLTRIPSVSIVSKDHTSGGDLKSN